MGRKLWELTKQAYDNRCCYCLTKIDKPTMEHLLPRSKGGKLTWENIAPACHDCNNKRSNEPIWVMLNNAETTL